MPSRRRARNSRAIATRKNAGRIFRLAAKDLGPLATQALGKVLGGERQQEAIERAYSSPTQRARQIRLEEESGKALKALNSFYKEKKGKLPPKMQLNGVPLENIKVAILESIFKREMLSFDEMRAFLHKEGFCLSEGYFLQLFKQLFSEQEARYLAQIFHQRNKRGTPIGVMQAGYMWEQQQKKVA